MDYSQLGETEKAAKTFREFQEQRPDWTVEKERQTLSYRHSVDEEHWLAGVRKAGLPEQ